VKYHVVQSSWDNSHGGSLHDATDYTLGHRVALDPTNGDLGLDTNLHDLVSGFNIEESTTSIASNVDERTGNSVIAT